MSRAMAKESDSTSPRRRCFGFSLMISLERGHHGFTRTLKPVFPDRRKFRLGERAPRSHGVAYQTTIPTRQDPSDDVS